MNGQVNTLGTKKNTYNNISRPKKNRHLQKKKKRLTKREKMQS